jgi:ketosteroid isomerase-like protein
MTSLRNALRFSALLFLLTWALPAAVSAQETQDTTKLARELRAARNAMSAGYAKMAGADVAAHYADDIVVMFGPEEIRGKEMATAWITQQLTALSGLRVDTPTFTVKADEVSERSGYTVSLPDGSSQTGTVETVWKKQTNGAWKVSRMTVT